MSASAQNVKLGTCNVFYNGVDLGLTKGGVEVEVSTSTYEVMVDQHGETPISEIITGRQVSAKVPLVETKLDHILTIMPGSLIITDGAFASGTVTFSTAAPVSGNKVTVFGKTFEFKTNPSQEGDMPVPTTVNEAAETLAGFINGAVIPVYATVNAGVVTVTAENRGEDGNQPITSVGTNIATVDMTGGTNVTKARVDVGTGINTNLIEVAQKLLLRPIGTSGEDDFIIHKAACPGALNFTYNTNQERIYQADFKGYVADDGNLFSVGDESAA